MGIDFSHCDARWSYSGFNRFRTILASCVGIDLDSMEGFERDWDNPHAPRTESIKWEEIAQGEDPICILLNHSDCDGDIQPEYCERVAKRLQDLLREHEEKFSAYDHQHARMLIVGLMKAGIDGKPLLFK